GRGSVDVRGTVLQPQRQASPPRVRKPGGPLFELTRYRRPTTIRATASSRSFTPGEPSCPPITTDTTAFPVSTHSAAVLRSYQARFPMPAIVSILPLLIEAAS